MQKKASLNLSINAIVILILAITMLALGLGFMRNMFGSVSKQFGDISDEVQKDMIQRLQESGKKVVLNKYEIEMKKSSEEVVYLAIDEQAAPGNGYSKFEISLADLGSGSVSNPIGTANCLVADQISIITGEQKILAGEAKVYTIYIKSNNDNSGTCKYTIEVRFQSFDKDNNAYTPSVASYASDDIFIKVV